MNRHYNICWENFFEILVHSVAILVVINAMDVHSHKLISFLNHLLALIFVFEFYQVHMWLFYSFVRQMFIANSILLQQYNICKENSSLNSQTLWPFPQSKLLVLPFWSLDSFLIAITMVKSATSALSDTKPLSYIIFFNFKEECIN